MAAFTIRAVDDPRTLNRVLYLRPPGNVFSLNELVGIWETKIGKSVKKNFVSEEELLRRIRGQLFIPHHHILVVFINHDCDCASYMQRLSTQTTCHSSSYTPPS